MDRETKQGKEFSENLDKILAGQKAEVGPAESDDYKETLDFAQKVVELRASPSAEFKDQLKERLLSQLRQRVPEKRPGLFWEVWQNILYNPVWRTATATIVVLIVVGSVLWASGILPTSREAAAPAPSTTMRAPGVDKAQVPAAAPAPTPTPAPTPAPVPAPAPPRIVRFNQVPDVVSSYGQTAEIDLSFINEATDIRTISPFPPVIKIIELPDVKPPGIVVRAFPVGSGERALQPGESVTYSLAWDQKDDSGRQVAPGWYSVEVTLANTRGSAARVLVLPPGGVMEKNIEVNQSRTVNGITITLQRVELTATGMKVYAFNTPPGYNLPQGPMLPPPMFMMHAEAEYSVDGGSMKQAFPSGIRFLDNGVLHTWAEYLDPVPKTAKELTFRITKLGDWQGPWEFKVPLQ